MSYDMRFLKRLLANFSMVGNDYHIPSEDSHCDMGDGFKLFKLKKF